MLLLAVLESPPAQTSSPAPAPATGEAALGKRALGWLREALNDEDAAVRAAALVQWGELGNPAAVPLVKKALKDRNVNVRIEAATALHKLGDPECAPALQKIVAKAAVGAEGGARGAGPSSAQAEMKALARSKTRIRAIGRLAECGGEDAVKLFETTLKDKNPVVADATAVALAKMGFDEYGEPFVAALEDKDEAVRVAAVAALGELAKREYFDALRKAAVDPAVAVRVEAMRALGR